MDITGAPGANAFDDRNTVQWGVGLLSVGGGGGRWLRCSVRRREHAGDVADHLLPNLLWRAPTAQTQLCASCLTHSASPAMGGVQVYESVCKYFANRGKTRDADKEKAEGGREELS